MGACTSPDANCCDSTLSKSRATLSLLVECKLGFWLFAEVSDTVGGLTAEEACTGFSCCYPDGGGPSCFCNSSSAALAAAAAAASSLSFWVFSRTSYLRAAKGSYLTLGGGSTTGGSSSLITGMGGGAFFFCSFRVLALSAAAFSAAARLAASSFLYSGVP